MTLSVCLIVRDEQAVIGRCLNCVSKFADEIIVVDTGSTDKTVEEAKKYTDEIYFFEWCKDFSAARNFAFEKASSYYVMWLDADDVITDSNCVKIKNLIKQNFDMAYLPYVCASDGEKPTYLYYRERIFKRAENYRFEGAVHEAVSPRGNIVYSDAEILHKKVKAADSLRNLNILQNQIASGVRLDARSVFYYGRELMYNKMFRESIAVLENFLNMDGWVENKLEACLNLYYCYSSLGEYEKALSALLKSFTISSPTSEVCCILGHHFIELNDKTSAIYWYEQALKNKKDISSGAFVNLDYCGYVPYMQLCVLYDSLGDYKKACACNEEAGKIKPNDVNYLNNKKYFRERLGKEV